MFAFSGCFQNHKGESGKTITITENDTYDTSKVFINTPDFDFIPQTVFLCFPVAISIITLIIL